jgi:hypothetical protein
VRIELTQLRLAERHRLSGVELLVGDLPLGGFPRHQAAGGGAIGKEGGAIAIGNTIADTATASGSFLLPTLPRDATCSRREP